MKYLLVFLFLCSTCYASDCCDKPCCQPVCKCHPCTCGKMTEAKVDLPNDTGKLYVSLYVQNDAQAKALCAKHPEIARYKAGNHYNVYTKSNPLMASRFTRVTTPIAYVQTQGGDVVWCSETLPWRRNHCQPNKSCPDQKQGDESDQVDNQDESPAVPADESNPLLLAGLALLSVAGGAGSKLWDELKSK